jgi:1-acyl-sn-glycerol-3-phosphate acyltransferase
MALGLGALALICLSWLPFAMLLHPLLPRRLGLRLGRFAIRAGFRAYLGVLGALCGCRFDLLALDALRNEGPLILAANHPSLLDAVLIVSRVPNVACIMKASLMDNLLFGAAARLARYIRNSSAMSLILGARAELQEGARVLIFPEGSRTVSFPVDPCSRSTGLISARAGVPVQTLCIDYSTPYLGKSWPLFRRPVLPLRCRIRLGRRFPPPTDVAAFSRELEAYFRAELAVSYPSSPTTPTVVV